MDQHWREALEGLKESTDHLITASQAIAHAGVAITKTIEALEAAHAEHEDLAVTVARLEGLVLELVERGRRQNGAG
jgi:hypothetical protein